MPRMKASSSLTAEEVKQLRDNTRLSQSELARALCLGSDAIKKWEQAKSVCSGPAAILLRLISKLDPKLLLKLAGDLPPEFVEAVELAHQKRHRNGSKHSTN